MRKLPKSEWTMELSTNRQYLIVGSHENLGFRHYHRVPLSDLPNDEVSLDDLKRFGIDLIDLPTVGESHAG